jgi:hypothetical protein
MTDFAFRIQIKFLCRINPLELITIFIKFVNDLIFVHFHGRQLKFFGGCGKKTLVSWHRVDGFWLKEEI